MGGDNSILGRLTQSLGETLVLRDSMAHTSTFQQVTTCHFFSLQKAPGDLLEGPGIFVQVW